MRCEKKNSCLFLKYHREKEKRNAKPRHEKRKRQLQTKNCQLVESTNQSPMSRPKKKPQFTKERKEIIYKEIERKRKR
ncbi:hypothetical protein P167DRAFT_46652 [Morchella conica CCBAS932]|uniref:Uncharacterized protein n=1 Tax=Morchella conica CCBAS932 TaxID=1392247 RepID=A0A3N4KZD6_9PEZI|nr:hypothetical protein P167DRAFT_46652 [Morchella conica CCBAS932]